MKPVLKRINQSFVRLFPRDLSFLLLPQTFHIPFKLVRSKLNLVLLRFEPLFRQLLSVLLVLLSHFLRHRSFRRLFFVQNFFNFPERFLDFVFLVALELF